MKKARRVHAPILGILAIAAVVRYWGIGFCLPADQCRPDEDAVASIVFGMFRGRYNPGFFDWPSLFLYAVTLSLVPYFKLGLFLGWFRGEGHFIDVAGWADGGVILTARVLSAAAGVISVWLVYRIALRLFDRATALVAALFLSLAFLHARDSHFGVPDVTAVMFVLVSLLFAVRYFESRTTRDLVFAAVAAGLAASTKYNAALIVLAVVWAVLASGRESGAARRANLVRVGLVFAVMVAAFVLTSPYTVLDYPRFARSLQAISTHLAEGHAAMLGRGWTVHLTSSLWYGLGWPLLVAGLAGLAHLAWKSPRHGVLVAIFPVSYYALIGSGYTVFARYILPVVPFLCLAAAVAVIGMARRLGDYQANPARARIAGWILAAVVVAPSAWSVFQFDRLLGRPDSRVVAADWIAAHFPEGASITVAGRMSTRPQFRSNRLHVPTEHRVFDVDDPSAPEAPDLLVVATTRVAPGAHGVTPGDRARALMSRYRLIHVVVAYHAAATGLVYDWQDEFYVPFAGFGAITRPGPTLTIYARPDVAAAKGFR